MEAGKRVAALYLCATTAAATNATWCSARNMAPSGRLRPQRKAGPAPRRRRASRYYNERGSRTASYTPRTVDEAATRRLRKQKNAHEYKDSAPAQRRAVLQRQARRLLSSKHELDRSSAAHAMLEKNVDALSAPARSRDRRARLNLTDWFASAFQPGGWLGMAPTLLGHVAFVLNLTPDDNAFRGRRLGICRGARAASQHSRGLPRQARTRCTRNRRPPPRGSRRRLAITGVVHGRTRTPVGPGNPRPEGRRGGS